MSAEIPAGTADGAIPNKRIESDADFLDITPLGAGNEVGRSCHILKFKGKTIMLDCGIHPAYTGLNCLPYFDEINPAEIDLLLVSHFHLDHAAALPYFLTKTDFKGRCFMTHPTKSIYRLILQDYVKVSSLSVEESLYTEDDLSQSMSKIEGINYHEVQYHKGIKFWCYNAGHVLGAAMFMIEIAGVRILYTGDYSRREDRHLMAAELPEFKPDVLIVESTYGVQTLEPVAVREKRLTDTVKDIVYRRGGKCLIPAFALGRAQEVLLMLEEYWSRNPALQTIPIYFASALARKCMLVYQTFTSMMNERIRRQSQISNPFKFKFVSNLLRMDDYDDQIGPCVVMASPGMLQNGLSRELFEQWCPDSKNGCVIPGYVVEGTLAHQIKSEPSEIPTLNGLKLPLRMSVHYISFSAHADYSETSEFIELLRPTHVILVHGEANEMARLKQALQRKYADGSIQIASPKNCQMVQLEFKPQKIGKIMGKLANTPLQDNRTASGLIVRKDFNYLVMEPDDLSNFSNVSSSVVRQQLTVPFHHSYETAVFCISQMFEISTRKSDTPEVPSTDSAMVVDSTTVPAAPDQTASEPKPAEPKIDEENLLGPIIQVQDSVKVCVYCAPSSLNLSNGQTSPAADHIVVDWFSNPVNDMVADAVIALLMSCDSNPTYGMVRVFGRSCHSHQHDASEISKKRAREDESNAKLTLDVFLRTMFTSVTEDPESKSLTIESDGQQAVVNMDTLAISCANEAFKSTVETVVDRFDSVLSPLRLKQRQHNE